MEPTFKRQILERIEDLRKERQEFLQAFKALEESLQKTVTLKDYVLEIFVSLEEKSAEIFTMVRESPEYELEPEPMDSIQMNASVMQEIIDELESHKKGSPPPVSNTERISKEVNPLVTDCVTDKKDLSGPTLKQVEAAILAEHSLKTLREKTPLKWKRDN